MKLNKPLKYFITRPFIDVKSIERKQQEKVLNYIDISFKITLTVSHNSYTNFGKLK